VWRAHLHSLWAGAGSRRPPPRKNHQPDRQGRPKLRALVHRANICGVCCPSCPAIGAVYGLKRAQARTGSMQACKRASVQSCNRASVQACKRASVPGAVEHNVGLGSFSHLNVGISASRQEHFDAHHAPCRISPCGLCCCTVQWRRANNAVLRVDLQRRTAHECVSADTEHAHRKDSSPYRASCISAETTSGALCDSHYQCPSLDEHFSTLVVAPQTCHVQRSLSHAVRRRWTHTSGNEPPDLRRQVLLGH